MLNSISVSNSSFLSPIDLEQFRKNAHLLIDLIADAGSNGGDKTELLGQKRDSSVQELLGTSLQSSNGSWGDLQLKLQLLVALDSVKNRPSDEFFSKEKKLAFTSALADFAYAGLSSSGVPLSVKRMYSPFS